MDASATQAARKLRASLVALGRDLTRDLLPQTQALLAPLHALAPNEDIVVKRDIFYGEDPRHRLDLFLPPLKHGQSAPVLLFVHGGGFVGGDKKSIDLPFHDNVGFWAARNGMVGINMIYRLAPQFAWPSGADDVGAAIRWIGANAAVFGGDSARVFAMGTSAGASHVAEYVASNPTGVRGAVLVSGVYDSAGMPGNKLNAAYFGTDTDTYGDRFPIQRLAKVTTRLLIATAELDPPYFMAQTLALLNAIYEQQQSLPALCRIEGHNHFSSTMHLNALDSSFGREMLTFFAA